MAESELVVIRRDHFLEVLTHEPRVDGGTTLRISQAELATFLGLSRQVVNQYLQAWLAQGWVQLGRDSVTIRNEPALKRLCGYA